MSRVDGSSTRDRRYRELDGLRGIAALVVLGYHALLLVPALSAIYVPGGTPPAQGSALWWLTYSPLKLLSSGPEAVILFFVLSGFVLALPAMRDGFDWTAYFPRRFARLMIPVAGAVALAALIILAIPQPARPSFSGWMNASVTPALSWQQVFGALNLFNGDTHIDNPLWSIQWEMIFSFTLPVFIVLAIVVRRWWALGIVAAVAVAAIGSYTGATALKYLPVFLVGVLLAAGLDRLERVIDFVNAGRARMLVWATGFVAALALIIGPWLLGDAAELAVPRSLLSLLLPLGAALLVVTALGSRLFGRLLRAAPLQYAGRISFSLYLVHAPVLVAVQSAFPEWPLLRVILVGIVASLLMAIAFFHTVESPAHRLSMSAGRWGAQALRSPRGVATPRVHAETSQSPALRSSGD